MLRRRTATLMKRAQTLAGKGDDSVFELAEALAELWALPKPPDGDRPTLKELIDLTKKSRRAIFYLIKVWRTFRDLGVPRDRLVRIGGSKLAVVAENFDPGTLDRDLALAQTCVAKELPRRLKGRKDRGEVRTVHLKRGLARKENALMRALRRPRTDL